MKDVIINSLQIHLDTIGRLVGDVEDARMTQQPTGVPNHAAWILGHLAYSFQGIGEELGLDPWVPEDWPERFGTGSAPVSDPAENPSKDALVARLAEGERRLVTALRAMSEDDLARPLPDEQHRAMFPTLGHALAHVVIGHTAAHIGQLTVWRRAMGLPYAATVV
jgi:hypothetical protein